jgi:uncharacterized protein YecE (DUF72 family)
VNAIHLGTCGWSYKDWNGVFYPQGFVAADYLGYYATRYQIVEVDSSFYASPSAKLVQGWRDKTPPSFGFSLKVPQTITHEKVLADCGLELELFLKAARILESKLLCCLLQFGFFNAKVFPDLDAFLARLDPFLAQWPADIPVAVEIRNKAWIGAPLLDCLRSHNAVLALADQAWMPSPWSLVRKFDTVTGPFAYLRLLGDRQAVDNLTPTLDRIVIDRTEQMRADAQAILALGIRVPVLTFVNNHFAGHAPETLRQLEEELARQQGVAPRATSPPEPKERLLFE